MLDNINREGPNYNKEGRLLALFSFLIGNLIFVLSFLIPSDFILMFGFFFVVLASLVNIVMIILILINYPRNTPLEMFKTVTLMLLNIPACALYIWGFSKFQ